MEQHEENCYAAQTNAVTRMRGMLEDEATQRKNAMLKELQQENIRMALEKKQREEAARKADQEANHKEI